MIGALLIISWIVLWFFISPSSAGEWFFKARKKYLELTDKEKEEKL